MKSKKASIKDVLSLVRVRREEQKSSFDDSAYTYEYWLAVLMEEVGEVAQSVVDKPCGLEDNAELKRRLVQVAAVAVAMIERIDKDCDLILVNAGKRGG